MLELGAVVVFLLVLLGAGFAAWVPVDTLVSWGAWIFAIGNGFGVPAGVLYHVVLYRALKRQGDVPKGWIWRPIDLHRQLPPGKDRRIVFFWGYLGGAGFVVIIAGALPLFLALWRIMTTHEPS